MTKNELLLMQICEEVALERIHSDRFTQLWLETGVPLDGPEFEVANRLLRKREEIEEMGCPSSTLH